MNLELLSTNENNYFDDCSPECLPFENSLNEDLKNAQGKTQEELDKEWEVDCEESREQTEEYRSIEFLNDFNEDYNDDDGYSSEEDIPTCNPWRE